MSDIEIKCDNCNSFLCESGCRYCKDKGLFAPSSVVLNGKIKELEKENEKLKEASQLTTDAYEMLEKVYEDISFFEWSENELFEFVDRFREKYNRLNK